MKIAIVTKTDESGGGASRVAADEVQVLRSAGVDVDHWLGYRPPGDATSEFCLFPRPWRFMLWRYLGNFSRYIGLRETLTPHYRRFRSSPHFESYDLVHFHDTYTCFSPQGLLRVANEKPVVWTLHDTTGVTDMCISPMCDVFPLPCTGCPHLGRRFVRPIRRRTAGFVQRRNMKVHASGKVVAVVPSEWMKGEVERAVHFAHDPVVIHNAVDLSVFRPTPRAEARRKLDLPLDRAIVLIGSYNLWDDRKNAVDALKALRAISTSHRPLVLALGHAPEESQSRLVEGLDVRHLGYISDRDVLATSYSASDCLLVPSKSESFGLQVAESMACGVPVVAYNTAALPELITHQQDGYLACLLNVEDLVTGLKEALTPEIGKAWGDAARRKTETHFGRDLFLKHHIELYQRVLRGEFPGLAGGRDSSGSDGLP